MRGDIVEVYKILNNKYDNSVNLHLSLSNCKKLPILEEMDYKCLVPVLDLS